MSRKHFKALADALKAEKPSANWSANKHVQWELDVNAIANTCATFNANFKRERFLAACGGGLCLKQRNIESGYRN